MIDRVPLLPVNTRNPCFFALTISINLPSKNDPPLRDQTFSLNRGGEKNLLDFYLVSSS